MRRTSLPGRPRVLFCAAVYEAARPWLAEFQEALAAAGNAPGIGGAEALLVADGLADRERTLAPLSRALPTRVLEGPAGAGMGGVRAALLAFARRSEADVLVFADCDDALLPEAAPRHVEALAAGAGADFSYADARLVGPDGRELGGTLYGLWRPPARIAGAAALAGGNFVGLGAAAARRTALTEADTRPPSDLVTVDWWLFLRLLHEGREGALARGPVSRYRLHGANVTGVSPDPALPAVERRTRLAADCLAALPEVPEARAGAALLERVRAEIEARPARVAALAREVSSRPWPWYGDVLELGRRLGGGAAP